MSDLFAFDPEFLANVGVSMDAAKREVVDALKAVAAKTAQRAADGDIEAIEFLQDAGLYANAAGELEELDPDGRCDDNSVIHSRTHPDD